MSRNRLMQMAARELKRMARHTNAVLMIIRWLEAGSSGGCAGEKGWNVCNPTLCLMHEQNTHKSSMFAAPS